MSIKSLANQTIWYGLSSIVGRFINYGLTPLLTVLGTAQYGEYTTVYAYITFFNIIFTYGMETAYFRFVRDVDEKKVFNTASTSLLMTTLPLCLLMLLLQKPLSILWSVPNHPEYVIFFALIVSFDTLAVIPFSKLRFEQRPMKFAIIKITNILLNVFFVLLFIHWLPKLKSQHALPFITEHFDPNYGIGYAFVANTIASISTLFLLYKEVFSFKLSFDKELWKKMMLYALPLIIVGFGGMINETIDRAMLPKLLPGSLEFKNSQNGIYGANYKLAILIVLFIQAFRMGAEPYFLKSSAEKDAPKTYARIMNLFIVVCTFCFLGVTLFLDIWKYFMRVDIKPEYAAGLVVVPILLMAKLLVGIYYNLSIWYKITNKTLIGAWITLGGTAITLTINFLFIPTYSYIACAWASLFCNLFMVIASFILGQKNYPIPYQVKKIIGYLGFMLLVYFIHVALGQFIHSTLLHLVSGFVLLLLYAYIIIFRLEKEEFSKFPIIGKYIQ
ncbi:MAG: oligosaccharide flippase family protein [Chitinophagaceae bacterium]